LLDRREDRVVDTQWHRKKLIQSWVSVCTCVRATNRSFSFRDLGQRHTSLFRGVWVEVVSRGVHLKDHGALDFNVSDKSNLVLLVHESSVEDHTRHLVLRR